MVCKGMTLRPSLHMRFPRKADAERWLAALNEEIDPMQCGNVPLVKHRVAYSLSSF